MLDTKIPETSRWTEARFAGACFEAAAVVRHFYKPLVNFFRPVRNPEPYPNFETMALTADRGCFVSVSTAHSQRCWCSPEINYQLRCWHDWTHLVMNLGFKLEDELRVAKSQLRQARMTGVNKDAQQVLYADLAGQVLAHAQTNRFPHDQRAFVRDYVQSSAYALRNHDNGKYNGETCTDED